MRREGLLVLRDIFCKETPSCAFGLFSAMVVQDFIRDITCITNDTHSALSMWKDNLSLLVEAQDLDRLYDLLSFRNNVASQPGVRDPEYQEQYTSLGEIGGQFNGATSSPISFLSYAIQDDVPMHDSPSPSPTVSPELWMNPAASLPNIHLGPGNYSSGTQCNFINELDNMNGSTSFLSPEFGQLFPPPPQQYRPNDQPPFASPTPEPQHPIHPLNPSSVTALTASGNGLNRTAPFQLFLKFLNGETESVQVQLEKILIGLRFW
ncbi:hypothetical protein F5Y15DRAFT_126768 [Xylariaceae sp. FL0016]|nr:hypothetical protein F5Y15DRAFT_126768 [Xylariaceae sp. FL0016]